jgi:hypothetical protein
MSARIRITGLVAFAALAFAAPAHAMSETVDCANLQTALNQAVAGDTITLDQLCTASNSGTADGAFTLPNNVAFTLTGQAGSGAGFDGTDVTGSLLYGPSVGGPALGAIFTLSSLTVENASGSANGAVRLLSTTPGGITVQSMNFVNNTGLGGLSMIDNSCSASTASPFTLSGSTFTGNTDTNSTGSAMGGGAAILAGCVTTERDVSVTGNTFSTNRASSGTSSGEGALGGGLAVVNQASTLGTLTQSGNRFNGNSVAGSGVTTADYGGGGEWVQAMDLTSTDDSFIGNTATGATGPSGSWSWGAGLGILNTGGTSSTHNTGLATNLVSAGNTITGGTPADVNGAGIYIGAESLDTGTNLTLQDSTVSGNSSVAGGVAGIGGGPADQLTLTNTIDTGNTGGTDLGGFDGTGGSLTASYSDACASGAALPGAGNICAPPALISATDVLETAASPTIDKGSNALVPAGLTTDFFGSTRILAGTVACTGPAPAAIVDIGASEYVPPIPPCPPPIPKPPAPVVTKASIGNQQITLTTPSPLACTASTKQLAVTADSATLASSKAPKLKFSSVAFYIDKGVKHIIHKGRGKKRKKVTVYLANATAHHVPITVDLSLTGLRSGTHTLKIVLSYKETKKGKHGHKQTVTVTKTLSTKFSVC